MPKGSTAWLPTAACKKGHATAGEGQCLPADTSEERFDSRCGDVKLAVGHGGNARTVSVETERELMMERPKKGYARRKQVVIRPITANQLTQFLSSGGDKNSFVVRMAETLRQAWARIDELKPKPRPGVLRNLQQERDWETCERVLVVTDIEGGVEIFTESWVAVKLVEVNPWEDRDEVCAALSADWKRLDYPNKRTLVYPPFRDHLGRVNFDNVLESWHRLTVLTQAQEILERR